MLKIFFDKILIYFRSRLTKILKYQKNKKNHHHPKLIIHIGPAKCGSTTIQNFFSYQKETCLETIWYKFITPEQFRELNKEDLDKQAISTFNSLFPENLLDYDVIILSHEALCQLPKVIKNICYLAKNLVENIVIVGYSRKQSDFLVSSYNQWLFRSLERNSEVNIVLSNSGIDSSLFTGLERQLIASIIDDFYSARQLLAGFSIINWYDGYNDIFQAVQKLGAVIKCGILPSKKSSVSLIQDFCTKSELILGETARDSTHKIANTSFHEDIIEAINNGIIFEIEMPGPHEMNRIIDLLSSEMHPKSKNKSEFLASLKLYIDTYYWDSNKKFCTQYGLDESYFMPAKFISKGEILNLINNEAHQRSLSKTAIINNYRELSAKLIYLCIRIANNKFPKD